MLVSIERTFIIKDLKSEKELITEYDQILEKKPVKKGSITFKSFNMRYRPELPLILKNVSFSIQDGERVGIVGRTGAGKSSLIQAIFRIAEPEPNSVYQLDEYDSLQMGLHTLRRNLSVIPQTPFLFKGTVKSNLDPFGEKSDEELWLSLQQAGLEQKVREVRFH